MTNTSRRPWTQNRRFEFIEWKLFWEGALNRSDLEGAFEISTPQASMDLRGYREVAGNNIEYSLTEKTYLPSARLKPKFLRLSADRLLLQLRAWLIGALPREDIWFKAMPAVDMAPDISRNVDPECLRRLLQAIRLREAIEIRYQSLTNTRWRKIAPHALAFDGYRWHVRAWAIDREDFRDFVISRIDEMGSSEPADFDPEDDRLWAAKAIMRLCPHPDLSDEQAESIKRDFNMTEGVKDIEVRLSMAYYFIMRMNLDLDNLPPARAQIRLQNKDEIEKAIETAKTETRQRIAVRCAAHDEKTNQPTES